MFFGIKMFFIHEFMEIIAETDCWLISFFSWCRLVRYIEKTNSGIFLTLDTLTMEHCLLNNPSVLIMKTSSDTMIMWMNRSVEISLALNIRNTKHEAHYSSSLLTSARSFSGPRYPSRALLISVLYAPLSCADLPMPWDSSLKTLGPPLTGWAALVFKEFAS